VTESDTMASSGVELPPSAMAGVLLRVAREAAGLSIDMVAQQLKLAPRQVKALEDGDYTHLPGRTFVRGFVRNYARLVHLDAERVLRALPAGASAPALEAPTLTQTAPTMGELPTTDHTRTPWARWAIPLTLVAIIVAAGIYEWMRPPGEIHGNIKIDATAKGEVAAPAAAPKDAQGTTLRNPLAVAAPAAESPAVAPATSEGTGTTVATATPAPATTSTALPSPATAATGASSQVAPALANTAPAPVAADANAISAVATPRAPAAEQPLALVFRDYSWTEVRDRDGRVLLSGMYKGGTAQNLSGTPPLDLVIGNAVDVTLSYKGEPVDLVPYTRQNVARLTLR
jgi:cytoskeleton protein RodZ